MEITRKFLRLIRHFSPLVTLNARSSNYPHAAGYNSELHQATNTMHNTLHTTNLYNKFTWTLKIKIIQWISVIWFQIYCQGEICYFGTQWGTMVFLIAQRHLFTLDYFQMQLLLKGLESDPFFHSTMTKKAQKPRTGKELI